MQRAASASRSSAVPGGRRGAPVFGSGTTIASFTFRPYQRLRQKAEFDHVYQQGWRVHQKLFQAVVCRNALQFPRLGLSIAARAVGNAVARNRLRRQIREAFRHREDMPGVDIIISAKSAARTADNPQVRADLDQLLTAIRDRCTRSPPSFSKR